MTLLYTAVTIINVHSQCSHIVTLESITMSIEPSQLPIFPISFRNFADFYRDFLAALIRILGPSENCRTPHAATGQQQDTEEY